MNFQDFFTNDIGNDKVKIVNAIADEKISKSDLDDLISLLKEKDYFRESDFTAEDDKTKWTATYISDLSFKCIQYFSEPYLRHLYEVVYHVSLQKERERISRKKKRVLKLILLCVLAALLLKVCGKRTHNDKINSSQFSEAITNGK